MKNKICVVITGRYRWTYYEWFLLGFYKLRKLGEIKLKFKIPFFSKLLTYPNINLYYRVMNLARWKYEKDTYNMIEYVIFTDGIKNNLQLTVRMRCSFLRETSQRNWRVLQNTISGWLLAQFIYNSV